MTSFTVPKINVHDSSDHKLGISSWEYKTMSAVYILLSKEA